MSLNRQIADIIYYLSLKQNISSAMVIVDNQDNSDFTRPDSAGAIYWIGSASPSNAAEYDMWWSG